MKDKKPSCPICKSRNILTNKDGLRRCRVCGEEWKVKIVRQEMFKDAV